MKARQVQTIAGLAGWPRGWWIVAAGQRFTCCHESSGPKGRVHQTQPGEALYLTGMPGEVYCPRHARGVGAPALELEGLNRGR